MLLKGCGRCGVLVPYGVPYCKECLIIIGVDRERRRIESKHESDRRYNKTRDPKYMRFYRGRDWKVLSARYMQDKGYRCQGCGSIATQVHHRIPIQTEEGWTLRLDYDNLELLCVDCHNKRHDRFKRRDKNKTETNHQ